LYHDPFDYLQELASKPLDDGNSEASGQPLNQVESFDDPDKSFINSRRSSNYPKVFLLPSTPGAADEKKVERRKKEREKYYEKTGV
jgi:hypothetical protein